MDIIIPTSTGHWYDIATGESRHMVPYADKKRKGEFRAATIKDAKANGGWAPSVTSILKIIDKEALTIWQVQQAILSALTLPREHGEIDDAFAKRIVDDMKAQTRKAADRGTKIHNAAERFLLGKPIYLEPELNDLFFPLMNWLEQEVEEVIMAEEVLVHREEQYAGTVDLIAVLKSYGPNIVDIKTQNVKAKPIFYQDWGLQLEAYRQAYQHSFPKASPVGLISLVVGSEEAREPECYQWPEEETEARIEAFAAAHTLWRWAKQFPKTPITPLEQF